VQIELLEGEEVIDKIYTTLQQYSLSFDDRQNVMRLAKGDGVVYTREYAHVLSESVVVDDAEGDPVVLDIFDDGKEPVDVIYEFTVKNEIEGTFEQLSHAVLPKVCQLLACNRMVPLVYVHKIVDGNGMHLGKIEILKDEEPIDAVDRFASINALDYSFRDGLMKDICQKVSCNRYRPVVFRQDVNDETGILIGTVEVLEGEEVIDAAFRFLRKTGVDVDEVALKNYLLQHVCGNQRVRCTRNIAHVFDKDINEEDGSLIGRLVITEFEEPADKVHQFCKEVGCQDVYMWKIIEGACASDLVICNRRNPVIFTLPLNDPDGNFVGNLGIELNEEPADAVYRFFAFHGLFAKDWDLASVTNQLCELSQVECKRKKAVKFYKEEFNMGGVDVGQMVVWDDEEVIDKLFQKRLEFNITFDDQMEAFSTICTKRDVHCARSQAVIYELKDITKRDFEKYGNETCSRKYNGWQFLTSIAESFIGSKLRSLVVKESMEKVRVVNIIQLLLLRTAKFSLVLCLMMYRSLGIHSFLYYYWHQCY